jgi:hypothetical protein
MISQKPQPEASPHLPFRQPMLERTNREEFDEQPTDGLLTTTENTLQSRPSERSQPSATTNGQSSGRRKRQRSPTMSSQTGENTFHQKMQIRVRHSVGSMSISPSSRDIVLAG